MRRILVLSAFLVVAAALSACGGGGNFDPSVLGGPPPYPAVHGQEYTGEKNFAKLLNAYTQATPERTPWAGYWWPYTANGIASGKQTGGLSPAGRYDAARGGHTRAQSWEIRNHGAGVPKVQQWWGHCNGWCAAAALYPEPRESVRVNGITFDVADIKALLTEAGMTADADFYGERVDWGSDYNTPKYWDTIPDQYFLVLTNFMGKDRMTVNIDRYTGDQVWNQPLVGYKFEYPKPEDYLGASPDAPNIYRIDLTSTIYWADDGVPPGILTPPFQWHETGIYQSRTLRMEVWLDGPVVFGANGKIVSSGDVVVTRKDNWLVGGTWKNGDGYLTQTHPDYMWVPYSLQKPQPGPDGDTYGNPDVDIDWIAAHILSGGVDDPSVTPVTPEPAPRPSAHPGDSPTPTPRPTHTITPRPTPIPTHPVPTPTHPEPRPTHPEPTPTHPTPQPTVPVPTFPPRPPRP